MNAVFQPVKSVLSNGLTVITMRTDRADILAGEIRIAAGTAHAAKMNPRWVGLPHYEEHLIMSGASGRYEKMEALNLLQDTYFISPNAKTDLTHTIYFTDGNGGQVLSQDRFWPALETTIDSVFFPKFDALSMEKERARVLEEIVRCTTPLRLDEGKFRSMLYGVDYMGFDVLGSLEQVRSYTQQDCFDFHKRAYTLPNTCIALVGGIDHDVALEKLERLFQNVSSDVSQLPQLDKPKICRGEFRRHIDGANEGYVEVYLNFPAANMADPSYFTTDIAMIALNRLINDKVKDKYGLYQAGVGYYAAQPTARIFINLATGQKEKTSEILSYALEVMNSPETFAFVSEKHSNIVKGKIAQLEVAQPAVQQLATALNNENSIGMPALSFQERIGGYRNTTPEQVKAIIEDWNRGPMFLNLRAHKDALDALPPIEEIDAWRSSPKKSESTPSPVTASPPPAP